MENAILFSKTDKNHAIFVDTQYKFNEMFNLETGFYLRSGIIEKNKDTGVDPFMRSFPALIDIGIMAKCKNAQHCPVGCYQNRHKGDNNMSLDDFKSIIDQIKGKTMQVALGGAGSPNEHENFKEIVKYAKENDVIPSYTTSGIDLTDEMIQATKEFCGAVAVSDYGMTYTWDAINKFIEAGITTNIHFVLGNDSIDKAIRYLKHIDYVPEGVNAIIFLLHKPVGLGRNDNVLDYKDLKVKEFFNLVDNEPQPFKIGFDSCTIPGVLNFTKNVDRKSIDSCEAARFSCYITHDMKMIPCSFDNQDMRFAVDLQENTIQEAWNSTQFEQFRNSLKNSCPGCKDREMCMGGCPLRRQIVLCERKERNLV